MDLRIKTSVFESKEGSRTQKIKEILFVRNKARWSLMATFVTATMLAGQLAIGGGQTDNYNLRAVPRPGKVVIDGNLEDWDLSGEVVMCYDLSTLLDKCSVA